MKLFGLILVLICSFLTGFYIKYSYSERVSVLEKCLQMVNELSISINYLGLDTLSLINTLSGEESLNKLTFLTDCKRYLESGYDFNESWNKAVNGFNSFLKKEDKEILISFGSLLGKSDIDGQMNNCRINSEKFSSQINKAKQLSDKYAELYFRLSVLSGILVSILII